MPTTTTDERSFVRFVLRRASFCDAFVIRNNFDGGGGGREGRGGGERGGGGEEEVEEEEEEEEEGNRSKGNSFRFSTKFFELPFENSRCESYTVFTYICKNYEEKKFRKRLVQSDAILLFIVLLVEYRNRRTFRLSKIDTIRSVHPLFSKSI
ncbi:hypothetical protein V1477_000159 [Vespula maculifrons]|uniref:Uncharacterized protein n=1 Tax=Vespula maculifrons TaxID=7453 RepID=A0ABD2D462_VESMC